MFDNVLNSWPVPFVLAYWKPFVAIWITGAVYAAWRDFANFYDPRYPAKWAIQELNCFTFLFPFAGCAASLGWLYQDFLIGCVKRRLKKRLDCSGLDVNEIATSITVRLACDIRIVNRFLRFLDGLYYGSSTTAELHAVLAASKSARWDLLSKSVLDELAWRGEPLPSWLQS